MSRPMSLRHLSIEGFALGRVRLCPIPPIAAVVTVLALLAAGTTSAVELCDAELTAMTNVSY